MSNRLCTFIAFKLIVDLVKLDHINSDQSDCSINLKANLGRIFPIHIKTIEIMIFDVFESITSKLLATLKGYTNRQYGHLSHFKVSLRHVNTVRHPDDPD